MVHCLFVCLHVTNEGLTDSAVDGQKGSPAAATFEAGWAAAEHDRKSGTWRTEAAWRRLVSTLPVPLRLAPVSVAHCGGDGGGSSKSNASREEDDNGEGEDDKNEDKDEELPLFQASTAMGITATGQCLHAL